LSIKACAKRGAKLVQLVLEVKRLSVLSLARLLFFYVVVVVVVVVMEVWWWW